MRICPDCSHKVRDARGGRLVGPASLKRGLSLRKILPRQRVANSLRRDYFCPDSSHKVMVAAGLCRYMSAHRSARSDAAMKCGVTRRGGVVVSIRDTGCASCARALRAVRARDQYSKGCRREQCAHGWCVRCVLMYVCTQIVTYAQHNRTQT